MWWGKKGVPWHHGSLAERWKETLLGKISQQAFDGISASSGGRGLNTIQFHSIKRDVFYLHGEKSRRDQRKEQGGKGKRSYEEHEALS